LALTIRSVSSSRTIAIADSSNPTPSAGRDAPVEGEPEVLMPTRRLKELLTVTLRLLYAQGRRIPRELPIATWSDR